VYADGAPARTYRVTVRGGPDQRWIPPAESAEVAPVAPADAVAPLPSREIPVPDDVLLGMASSGRDGGFEIHDLPEGRLYVESCWLSGGQFPHHYDRVGAWIEGEQATVELITPGRPSRADAERARPRERPVVFRVLDSSGRPVTGKIRAWLVGVERAPWTFLDGRGIVRLSPVPVGAHRVVIAPSGLLPREVAIEVPEGEDPVAITVATEAGARVRGGVTGPATIAPEDASITLTEIVEPGRNPWTFSSDRCDGDRVQVAGVPPGRYLATGTVLGEPDLVLADPTAVEVTGTGPVEVSWRFVRSGLLRVRLTHEPLVEEIGEDGGSVALAWARAECAVRDLAGVEVFREKTGGMSTARPRDADRGDETLSPTVERALPPGDYAVRVTSHAQVLLETTVTIRSGQESPLAVYVPAPSHWGGD
jgi:hypothetical protein